MSAVHKRLNAEQRLAREDLTAVQDAPVLAARRPVYTVKTIPARTTFTQFMQGQGLPAETVQALIRASLPVYNLALVHAGNKVSLTNSSALGLESVRYQIDSDHTLWITRGQGGFDARVCEVHYAMAVARVAGSIQDSLFQAVEAQGEGDELASRIADIFGWDIDFNTDTRPGDVFKVVVEKKFLSGRFAGYGRVLAAEYYNGHHQYEAVLFHTPEGRPAYYQPSGKSMQKAFLRSPLRFAARITSGFSYHRFHPVLKRYMPHLGIDYAAPVGSSVQAVADGTVLYAGWKGEDGRLVKLRHAHGYETYYMHLSRVMVRPGQRVEQGQIIALTGATGLVTGPHLDFRIEKHGQFKNFLTLNLPPAESVSRREWKEFERTSSPLLSELASLPDHPTGPEQADLQSPNLSKALSKADGQ